MVEAGGDRGRIKRPRGLRLQPERDPILVGLNIHDRKLLVFVGRA